MMVISKDVEEKIKRYTKSGIRDKDWYIRCQETIVDIFGEENLWLVSRLLAATSMNSTLKSNISLFIKAWNAIKYDEEFKGFMPVMLSSLNRVRNGEELLGRKTRNFAQAMSGDPDAIVVDMWIMRAFEMNKNRKFKGREIDASPTKSEYDEIEKWIKRKAKQKKLEPRQLCSMIWSGIRREKTGRDNPTRYCDILKIKFYSPLFKINHSRL